MVSCHWLSLSSALAIGQLHTSLSFPLLYATPRPTRIDSLLVYPVCYNINIRPCLRILGLLSSLLPSALLSSGRIGPLLLANPLAIVVSNSYPIPACPAAHAVPALVLDMAP